MPTTLYGNVAEKILQAIEAGTYQEGDRIPSIREQSIRFGVSLNTVKEAYTLLEAQHYIEGRPQSGFYVRRRVLPLPAVYHDDPASIDPTTMSICRIMGPLQEKQDSPGYKLGLANVDPVYFPDKLLHAHLIEQIKVLGPQALDYQFLPGDRGLREQIAQWITQGGIFTSPDDVLITNGCTEAFNLALRSICQTGDTIAVESPSYASFPNLANQMGLKVIEIPATPNEGMNIDILKFALDHYPIKAVLSVANHNNPLGSVIPKENKKLLVELLERKGVPLIEDDVYGDLSFDSQRPITCKAFDKSDNVLYCSSFSKTLVPGWRIGWILPGKYKNKVSELKALINYTNASVNQKALAAFLRIESYEKHLRRLRAHLGENMASLQETVTQSFPASTRMTRPEGGLSLWLELPQKIDSLELYPLALAEEIGFTPGPLSSTSGRFGNCIRLCSGYWSEPIKQAVIKLGGLTHKLLNQQPKKPLA